MKERPKITYFLGAGASSNALPMVKDFHDAILKFVGILKTNTPSLDAISCEKLIKSLLWIAEESSNHNTIDTYAKKLFLQGDKNRLEDLKIALSVCFIYWQFYDYKEPSKNSTKIKRDSRYISLLSSFLERNESDDDIFMPSNLNFITWNYDLQIELCLQYFVDNKENIEDIQSKFLSYPNVNLEDNKKITKIVHLNGIAGLYDNHKRPFPGIIIDRIIKDGDLSLQQLLKRVLEFYNNCTFNNWGINNTFSFAWENNTISKNGLNHAIEIMQKTDYFVIIGYSFPVFNREIDRKIFSSENTKNIKKIYYQDPEADVEALKETFDFAHVEKIKPIQNTNRFFLPFEF